MKEAKMCEDWNANKVELILFADDFKQLKVCVFFTHPSFNHTYSMYPGCLDKMCLVTKAYII